MTFVGGEESGIGGTTVGACRKKGTMASRHLALHHRVPLPNRQFHALQVHQIFRSQWSMSWMRYSQSKSNPPVFFTVPIPTIRLLEARVPSSEKRHQQRRSQSRRAGEGYTPSSRQKTPHPTRCSPDSVVHISYTPLAGRGARSHLRRSVREQGLELAIRLEWMEVRFAMGDLCGV